MQKSPGRKSRLTQLDLLLQEDNNPGSVETSLNKAGIYYILGIDEAGRGPAAGPVVAAACMLPQKLTIKGLKDSKKLTHLQRERLFPDILKEAVCSGIAVVDAAEIDRVNILNATFDAMAKAAEKAVNSSKTHPEIVIIDGNLTMPDFNKIPQKAIIKGDQLSLNIAAASILAKVTRDRIMINYDKLYPEYDFKKHKGYITQKHTAAIRRFGMCAIHRRTFKIKSLCY